MTRSFKRWNETNVTGRTINEMLIKGVYYIKLDFTQTN